MDYTGVEGLSKKMYPTGLSWREGSILAVQRRRAVSTGRVRLPGYPLYPLRFVRTREDLEGGKEGRRAIMSRTTQLFPKSGSPLIRVSFPAGISRGQIHSTSCSSKSESRVVFKPGEKTVLGSVGGWAQ